MPSIQFHANVLPDGGATTDPADATLIDHVAGSGLGFYGNGFRVSVPVGSQQDQTYVTNENGTAQGVQLQNTARPRETVEGFASKVKINGGSEIDLASLPNMSCPLNIRFITDNTTDTPVRVQNCKLRVFHRGLGIDTHAEEVSTYVYEARHPSNTQGVDQLNHRAYSGNSWFSFEPDDGVPPDMELTASPGAQGKNSGGEAENTASTKSWVTNQGASHASNQHDWYVAISSEPETIGSKTNYALYVTMEYLE